MRHAKMTNLVLCSVQWLIGLFFVLASGAPKLILPVLALDTSAMPHALPVWFVVGIGVVQVLGRRGLALPGLLGIRTSLAQLVAIGLMFMTGNAPAYPMAADRDDNPGFEMAVGFSLRIPTRPGGDVSLQIDVTRVGRGRRPRRHARGY